MRQDLIQARQALYPGAKSQAVLLLLKECLRIAEVTTMEKRSTGNGLRPEPSGQRLQEQVRVALTTRTGEESLWDGACKETLPGGLTSPSQSQPTHVY